MYWKEDREKRKQFEGIVAEKERQKKRDKWIRELEARDEEEIAFKAKLQRRMRGEEKSVTDAVKETWKEVKEGKE